MQSWADYLDILRLAHLSSGNTKFTVRAKNPDSSSVAQLI